MSTGPTECDFILFFGFLGFWNVLKSGFRLFEEAQILFLARSELLGYLRTFQVCLCCLWFIG